MDERPIPSNLWHLFINALRGRRKCRFFVDMEAGVVVEGGIEQRFKAEREQKKAEEQPNLS